MHEISVELNVGGEHRRKASPTVGSGTLGTGNVIAHESPVRARASECYRTDAAESDAGKHPVSRAGVATAEICRPQAGRRLAAILRADRHDCSGVRDQGPGKASGTAPSAA